MAEAKKRTRTRLPAECVSEVHEKATKKADNFSKQLIPHVSLDTPKLFNKRTTVTTVFQNAAVFGAKDDPGDWTLASLMIMPKIVKKRKKRKKKGEEEEEDQEEGEEEEEENQEEAEPIAIALFKETKESPLVYKINDADIDSEDGLDVIFPIIAGTSFDDWLTNVKLNAASSAINLDQLKESLKLDIIVDIKTCIRKFVKLQHFAECTNTGNNQSIIGLEHIF